MTHHRAIPQQTVVVTGASSGIGAATARLLARDGAQVVATGRDRDRLAQVVSEIREEGGEVDFVVADLTAPDAARTVVDRALDGYGRLDGAVNSAGINHVPALLADLPETVLSTAFDINVMSVFRCMQAQIKAMAVVGHGAIVNVSSIIAHRSGPYYAAYAASKAALLSLTRTAAQDHAADGIRVNAVAPGMVLTPMLDEVIGAAPPGFGAMRSTIPLGRPATPEEVATCIRWLLSPDASYVHGATLAIDGGLTA